MSSNNHNDQDGPSSSLPLQSQGAPTTESAGAAKSPSPFPSRYVYRDYSRVVPDDGVSVLEAITKVAPTNAKHQKLPLKLAAMLEDAEFSHIISWMPHGRSWRILKPKAFVKEVLPKHFDYCNYNSFVRLVNAWGFRRFTSGPDRNSYYHELFLRGLPHLHNKMRRVTGKEKKIPIDQDDEPDLYSISRANPLPCVSQSQGKEPLSQTAGDSSAPIAAMSSSLQTSTGPSESSSSALSNALRDPTLDRGSLAESIAQVLEANRIMSEAQNTVNRASALPLVARTAAAAAAPAPPQTHSQWTAAIGNSLASLSQVAASQAQAQQQQQQQQQTQQPAVLPQQFALSAQQQQFALSAQQQQQFAIPAQQQQLPLQQFPMMPQQFMTYGALPAAPGCAPQLGAVAPAPVLSAAPAAAAVQAPPIPAPATTAEGQHLAVMYIPVYTTVAAAGAQGAIHTGLAQQPQQQQAPQVATTVPQQAGNMLLPPQTQAGGNYR